jgi:putative hydrolases of HD superfamily
MSRTEDLFAFCAEVEKLKHVARQIWVPDHSRQENDAEHSWHMAMMLLVFDKELPATLDRLKTLKLILTHDLCEIYAGDTFAFDEEGKKTKQARELAAAKKLFVQLPPDLSGEFLALFDEFEANETLEAYYANAFDKLHAIFSNTISGCYALKKHKISYNEIERYATDVLAKAPGLREAYQKCLERAKDILEK